MFAIILLLAVLPAQFAGMARYGIEKQRVETRLEILLRDWDKAHQNIHEVHYTIQVTAEDRVLREKKMYQIEGFVKRDNLARINLFERIDKPTLIVFLNDRQLDIYKCDNKEKISWEIPDDFPEKWFDKGWGFIAEFYRDNREFFGFEFPVGKIHEEFETSLRQEDDNWAYIQLIPKTDHRKGYVKNIEVVLNQKNHLARQIRLWDNWGNLTIYDFQKLDINPKPPITLESISKDLPIGYKEMTFPLLDAIIKAPDSKSSSQ